MRTPSLDVKVIQDGFSELTKLLEKIVRTEARFDREVKNTTRLLIYELQNAEISIIYLLNPFYKMVKDENFYERKFKLKSDNFNSEYFNEDNDIKPDKISDMKAACQEVESSLKVLSRSAGIRKNAFFIPDDISRLRTYNRLWVLDDYGAIKKIEDLLNQLQQGLSGIKSHSDLKDFLQESEPHYNEILHQLCSLRKMEDDLDRV